MTSKPDFRTRRRHYIFTEEHERLREVARAFAEKELAPHAEEWEETTFPNSVFHRMGELGLLGLNKPEEYGGQGGDYYTGIVLAEELARSRSGGLAMAVILHAHIVMNTLLEFGTQAQKRQWVVPAIQGTSILSIGITEPDAGSDVAGTKTTAVRRGDEWVINGTKTFISNGDRADVIVLLARTENRPGHDAYTLFLVPMDTPGVSRGKPLHKLGMRASDTSLLTFEDVHVPADAVLGQEGRGFYHVMAGFQNERLISAASSICLAEVAFEDTLRYALNRTAFGSPIGRFQAIRHKFAEMATQIELTREFLYSCAWRYQNGDYPVREISMLKLQASRAAVSIADECIQIHGGAGYMTEYGVERIWRDLRLYRIGGGTDEIMLDVIGRSIGL